MPAALLLDACVTINLMATQCFDAIAKANQVTFVMVRQAAKEAMALRETADGVRVSIPIDLTPHLAAATLVITELAASELASYVQYASMVDDGEAATIAAAQYRGIGLATDDRAARRLCTNIGLPEPVWTVGLLRTYVERCGVSQQEAHQILIAVRDRASFAPSRLDPDRDWWLKH